MMIKYTLAGYQHAFNYSPASLEDFAEAAELITDCPELKEKATAFLKARDDFLMALADNEIAVG